MSYTGWNQNDAHATITISNGNRTARCNGDAFQWVAYRSIESKSSGKWYTEHRIDISVPYIGVGIAPGGTNLLYYVGHNQIPGSHGWIEQTGDIRYNSNDRTNQPLSANVGDIIGMAVDIDNTRLYYSRNGTWIIGGDPADGNGYDWSQYNTIDEVYLAGSLGYASPNQMTSNFDEDDLIYSVPEGYNIPDTIDVSPSAGILNLNSETKELTTQIESNIDIYIDNLNLVLNQHELSVYIAEINNSVNLNILEKQFLINAVTTGIANKLIFPIIGDGVDSDLQLNDRTTSITGGLTRIYNPNKFTKGINIVKR